MKKIISIFGWIVLLLVFASLGLSSDDPTFGFFFYLAFFLIVFVAVFFYIKKHQKRKEIESKSLVLLNKILGIILLIVALFSPIIALRKIQLPFMQNLLIFIATAILIALGAFAVTMIDKDKIKKLLGLVMLVVLSVVPAIFATTFLSQFFSNTYNALGTAYWAVISVSTFSWWGFSLNFSKK